MVEYEETRAKTELGATQKDSARELSAKLASLKGIVWVGVALFFGLATWFYPPLKLLIGSVTTSLAICGGGISLMILPSLIVGKELLILAGVAVAGFGDHCLNLSAGSHLVSQGAPNQMNHLVDYNSVQESPTNWVAAATALVWLNGSGASLSFRFTDLPLLQHNANYFNSQYYPPAAFTLQDCQLAGGQIPGSYQGTILIKNNLFERVRLTSGISSLNNADTLLQNLFFGGSVAVTGNPAGNSVFNNLFDHSTNSGLDSLGASEHHNAFIGATNFPSALGLKGDLCFSNFNYAAGPLGSYYQVGGILVDFGSYDLVDHGNTNAGLLGLYHHTTQTNQVPETNSLVDIGFHYVAVDASGQPQSTLWYGLPDYLAETNGELAAWELNYFGHTGLNSTDLDGAGNTLLADYQTGADPNVIHFTLDTTNLFVNQTSVPVYINLQAGIPSYYAVLVNDDNYADAQWLPYAGTNLTATLGNTNGDYGIWVGLKGCATNATATWDIYEMNFTLDRVPIGFGLTNPVLADGVVTVVKPYLQIQGWADKPLSSLTYEVSNDLGVVTGQFGSVIGQEFDTNKFDFTTNYFQCYDVPLTTNDNRITLHLTDRAGNTATTNFHVVLDYSLAVDPPVIDLLWPTNGSLVSGANITIRGTMSDETGTIEAQVVNGDNTTTIIPGVVERNHMFWLENVPLNGVNHIMITATDAAGHSATTNFIVNPSDLILTIDRTPMGDDLYKSCGTVGGTVSDEYATVVVNGVTVTKEFAWNGESWDWEADDVPIYGFGTATFDAAATPAEQNSPTTLQDNSREKAPYWAVTFYNGSESQTTIWNGIIAKVYGVGKSLKARAY